MCGIATGYLPADSVAPGQRYTHPDRKTALQYRDMFIRRVEARRDCGRDGIERPSAGQPTRAPASTAATADMLTIRRTVAARVRICTGRLAPSSMPPTVMPLPAVTRSTL